MNDLRTAAQQALEALEYGGLLKKRQAITALKAALAEPPTLDEAMAGPRAMAKAYENGWNAAKAEQGEPVAWMVYTPDGKSVCVTDNPADFTEQHKALPLYTVPPQRPAEPVQEPPTDWEAVAADQAMTIALMNPDRVEPVAWMYTGIKHDGTTHGPHLVWKPEYMDAMSANKGAKATPLYAAPPQRKPLSEEEIVNIFADVLQVGTFFDVARAIERAHGIK